MSRMRNSTLLDPQLCEESIRIECKITVWLWKIVPPILFLFGIIGNMINLIVFTRKQIRALSATIFLSFLAGSDLLSLVTILPRQYLLRFNIEMRDLSSFNCMFYDWISYTAGLYSVWLLVLLTVERLLCTLYPHWARTRITRRVCAVAAISTLLVVMSGTSQWLFMLELKTVPKHVLNGTRFSAENTTICLAREEQDTEYIKKYWLFFVAVFLIIVPITIIIIGNIFIAIILFRKARQVHPLSGHSNIHDSRLRSSAKVLFLLCFFSLLTYTPLALFLLIKTTIFSNVISLRVNAGLQLAQCISLLLLLCNFALNFLLYVYSGSKFRNELRQVMKSIKNHMLACVGRTGNNG